MKEGGFTEGICSFFGYNGFMTKCDLKTRFKHSGDLYLTEKKLMRELEQKYKDLKDIVFEDNVFPLDIEGHYLRGERELYRFMKENTVFVETILNKADETGIEHAGDILSYMIIEHHTQDDTAWQFQLTRRQLQYLLDRIYEEVFGNEQA